MKVLRWLAFLLLCAAAMPAQVIRKPKLVVIVVVDQFRYDYLTRFHKEYSAGLAKMLDGGAVFTNAHYVQAPTVTAVGHSIVATGAMPSASGIVGNSWLDRETGVQVTSVCDTRYKLVGAKVREHDPRRCDDYDPASPNRLEVTTIGDELRNADPQSVAIGVSLKARSAILPAGHRAKGAFWFDDGAGGFVSSTYYSEDLPGWVKSFNGRKLADKYLDRKWEGFKEWTFRGSNPTRRYELLAASPWGNELVESLAESAIDGEQLGQRASTDLLAVSFSANDYVGHQTGPDAEEVRDMSRRTDQLLGKLMDAVEAKVGAGKALFVLTADHGVAPLPCEQERRHLPGGYIFADAADLVNQTLNNQFGEDKRIGAGDWVLASDDSSIYLNWKKAGAYRPEVLRAAVDALIATPQIHRARVYSRDQLLEGVASDPIGRAVMNGFNKARGADIIMVAEPYWITPLNFPAGSYSKRPGCDGKGTQHSTPYEYDTHVPVIFYGAGIRAAQYADAIAVNDIAPTLASLLEVKAPSGSSGNVLPQIVARPGSR